MKRVLLDQGLAPVVAALLRQDGWDAIHVSEVGLDAAEDMAILDAASEGERVCVTLDHDFHAHLAMARAGRPSVVLLRVPGLSSSTRGTVSHTRHRNPHPGFSSASPQRI